MDLNNEAEVKSKLDQRERIFQQIEKITSNINNVEKFPEFTPQHNKDLAYRIEQYKATVERSLTNEALLNKYDNTQALSTFVKDTKESLRIELSDDYTKKLNQYEKIMSELGLQESLDNKQIGNSEEVERTINTRLTQLKQDYTHIQYGFIGDSNPSNRAEIDKEAEARFPVIKNDVSLLAKKVTNYHEHKTYLQEYQKINDKLDYSIERKKHLDETLLQQKESQRIEKQKKEAQQRQKVQKTETVTRSKIEQLQQAGIDLHTLAKKKLGNIEKLDNRIQTALLSLDKDYTPDSGKVKKHLKSQNRIKDIVDTVLGNTTVSDSRSKLIDETYGALKNDKTGFFKKAVNFVTNNSAPNVNQTLETNDNKKSIQAMIAELNKNLKKEIETKYAQKKKELLQGFTEQEKQQILGTNRQLTQAVNTTFNSIGTSNLPLFQTTDRQNTNKDRSELLGTSPNVQSLKTAPTQDLAEQLKEKLARDIEIMQDAVAKVGKGTQGEGEQDSRSTASSDYTQQTLLSMLSQDDQAKVKKVAQEHADSFEAVRSNRGNSHNKQRQSSTPNPKPDTPPNSQSLNKLLGTPLQATSLQSRLNDTFKNEGVATRVTNVIRVQRSKSPNNKGDRGGRS